LELVVLELQNVQVKLDFKLQDHQGCFACLGVPLLAVLCSWIL